MKKNLDPFILAKEHASDFEEIMGTTDLVSQIDALNGTLANSEIGQQRDIGLGEVLGAASLVVGLLSLMIQIRLGNTFQGETDKVIAERLILKLSRETSLPATARERLINKLIDINFDTNC